MASPSLELLKRDLLKGKAIKANDLIFIVKRLIEIADSYFPASLITGYLPTSTILTNTATLDFPSLATNLSADLTITVTGAAIGNAVALGVPHAAVIANSCYTGWVSAANTVTIRLNNYGAATINPTSQTFRATVFK